MQDVISSSIDLFGFDLNAIFVALVLLTLGVLTLFWRIQSSKKLDFADLITKDGRSVSLTKVLQLVGGLTATWIMVKMTLTGDLTEGLLGVYLVYIGGVEGYSKFVAAKYGYNETSTRDAVPGGNGNGAKVPTSNHSKEITA